MIPLEWYRNFVAVYRAGSVSGAARTRNLSQPAVSQSLAALEGAVGVPLFERTVRGMTPTARGEALFASVFEALDRLEGVTRILLPRSGVRPTLRLGASPEYFHEHALERLAPLDLPLVVSLAPDRDLLSGVETGALDAALTRLVPGRALAHLPLAEQPFVLIAPPGTAPLPSLNLAETLNSMPWVSYSEERPATRRFFAQTLGSRFAATPRLVVPDLRSVVRAVELGVGLSIVPEFACRRSLAAGGLVRLLDLDLPPDRWTLAFRTSEGDREEIAAIGRALR